MLISVIFTVSDGQSGVIKCIYLKDRCNGKD